MNPEKARKGNGGITMLERRIKHLLLFSFFVIFLLNPGSSAAFDPEENKEIVALIPTTYRAQVIAALSSAGKNWKQLASVLREVAPEQREGAAFLIANMPQADLVSISYELLYENIVYAYQAWNQMPWGTKISKPIFLKYVLPYRISLEPAERWRKDFYEQLYPRVEKMTSIAEAALEVNKWGAENCIYGPTYRFQSPYTTLKRHQGDCHTQTILYVAAARSVGIPARYVFTPYYPYRIGYHAWAEVWDGVWHCTGSCEPAPLDKPWFISDGTAKTLAKVWAASYARVNPLELGNIGPWQTHLLDVTSFYTPVGSVEVKVIYLGQPVANALVHFSLWNYNTLLPVTCAPTDQQGKARIELGDGTYFVTAGQPPSNTWQFVYVAPGETTKVHLELSAANQEEVYDFSSYDFGKRP